MHEKNRDLSVYRPLLCRLAVYSKRKDFDSVFKQVLIKAGIPETQHFLIKMEFGRLQKPCLRQIDLRGLVDGECFPFHFDGITHFLDDIAKSVFNTQYENFSGYTIGVYEAVNNTQNNFRVMHKQEKHNKPKHGSSTNAENTVSAGFRVGEIAFTKHIVRKEERMHYVSDVCLVVGESLEPIGRTIDISASGCQLKVDKNITFNFGDVLELRFMKLEEEFKLGVNKGLSYKVLSTEKLEKGLTIVRLCRISCPATKSFDVFIKNYINGNKMRYKINLDNTMRSVMNRGYSQYSMPRRTDFCILIKQEGDLLSPFMGIATELNKPIFDYWKNSENELEIQNTLTSNRLNMMKNKLLNGVRDTTLYTFCGKSANNEPVFFAATREEVENDHELMGLFFSTGVSKYHFKVFNLNLSESSVDDAYQPFSLMTDTIEVFKKLNKRPSPRVIGKLRGLSYVLSVTDITTEDFKDNYLVSFISGSFNEKMKRFRVKPNTQKPLHITPIRFLDLRREERFEHGTRVVMYIDKISLEAQTLDISTKGLKIRSELPSDFSAGQLVMIDLPEFNEISKSKNLLGLKYKIVSVNDTRTEFSLHIAGDVKGHAGRLFIRDLIACNSNFLLEYQSGTQDIELSWCVQNILSASSLPFTTYLTKKDRRLVPTKSSLGNYASNFFEKIKHGEEIDVSFLFQRNIYEKLIFNGFVNKHLHNNVVKHDIYISIINGVIESKLHCEFESVEEKIKFVGNAKEKGLFYCFSGSFARTGRPDFSRVSTELNYMSFYAIHKAKEIEDELWSIVGIIDLKDITDETLFRINLRKNKEVVSDVA